MIAFRTTGEGGEIHLSEGVHALGEDAGRIIVAAVQAFDGFTPDTDPCGEHDCAFVAVGILRVLFKIDYYDPTMEHHSENPADPEKTVRVMTIMFPEEY